MINIDEDQTNADWIKTVSWEFPRDMEQFLMFIGGPEQLEHFLTLPVAEAMPLMLRVELGLAHNPKGLNLKDFDPGQLRDALGRWTRGGGLEVIAREPTKKNPTRTLPSFDLSPDAEQALYADLEALGVTHEQLVGEIKDRIGDNADDLAEASKWYEEAHAISKGIADESDGKIPLERSMAVVAAISPRTTWPGNVKAAHIVSEYFLDGKTQDCVPLDCVAEMKKERKAAGLTGPIGFDTNLAKALEILDGAEIDTTLTGLKVRSFYNNIDDPGGTHDVTVDGHMAKMLKAVGTSEEVAKGVITRESKTEGEEYAGLGYIAISNAVRAVSTEWGVPPDTIQAAYWIKVQKVPWSKI